MHSWYYTPFPLVSQGCAMKELVLKNEKLKPTSSQALLTALLGSSVETKQPKTMGL